MRLVALMASCAALGVLAEEPSDFSASAPVTPANADALQRFVLPFAVYRDTRRDLADIRVFNANAEPVPIAFAGDPESTRELPRFVTVPVLPVSRLEGTTGARGTEVAIHMQDGTLVEVHGGGRAADAKKAVPIAYLLDASQLAEAVVGFELSWDAAPGTEVVPISIESSDDLQSWRTVAHATLWQLRQGTSHVAQLRARLGSASKAKYYRVTWSSAPAFRLRGVSAEYEGRIRSAPLETLAVDGRAGEKAGEFVFDLGARLPVEGLRIVPAESNSIATYTVLTHNPPDTQWRYVMSGTFYRLQRAGTEIESAPQLIARRTAREWMARVDSQTAGLGNAPPKLEVQVRRAQIVFVARGPGPWRLAFGDPDAKPAWVRVSTLMPDYKRGDELGLPEATVGTIEGGPPRRIAFLPARIAELGPRKLALWATLILAVAILAFMAWRLHRQMRVGK